MMQFVNEQRPRRSRARAAAIVASAAVVAFVVGGVGLLRGQGSGGASQPAVPAGVAGIVGPAAASGSLSSLIAQLQARVRDEPADWRSLASLGAAYVQQARVTADPSYYPKAEGVLDRSLRIQSRGNFAAYVGRGSLEAARHDFSGALRDGERAAAIDPYSADVYGVIGDAQIELGRYREAFATFQKMVDTKPTLASYARVSYARELQGDVAGAVTAMKEALAAAGSSSDAAWASFQLGELAFNSGHVEHAAADYRRARALDSQYIPPQAGLAKVAWGRGRIADAIRGYERVTALYPLPEYVIALGDLYRVSGRAELARQQTDVVRAEETLFQANGVNVDLEIALYNADHGRPTVALQAARDEWARRHSIHVADALGWALYANGRYRSAERYARLALRLGTRNALFFFHAGMIQDRLGDAVQARSLLRTAVDINPHFSILWFPVARATLRRLGGA
jgi:tetratricopeptide (TPR) repeat protein